MPFYEKGNVRIRYEEAGSGFPLFIIHGGGLNSKAIYPNGPFDAPGEFKSEYRCITMDLRNANGGQSTGPLDFDDPWNAHTSDQLGLLDHLGVDKFFVMGFCIGNPLIWNLLQRAPGRIVAAVSSQKRSQLNDSPRILKRSFRTTSTIFLRLSAGPLQTSQPSRRRNSSTIPT